MDLTKIESDIIALYDAMVSDADTRGVERPTEHTPQSGIHNLGKFAELCQKVGLFLQSYYPEDCSDYEIARCIASKMDLVMRPTSDWHGLAVESYRMVHSYRIAVGKWVDTRITERWNINGGVWDYDANPQSGQNTVMPSRFFDSDGNVSVRNAKKRSRVVKPQVQPAPSPIAMAVAMDPDPEPEPVKTLEPDICRDPGDLRRWATQGKKSLVKVEVPKSTSKSEYERRWELTGEELKQDFSRVMGLKDDNLLRGVLKARRGQNVYYWGVPGIGKSQTLLMVAEYYGVDVTIIPRQSMFEMLQGSFTTTGDLIQTSFVKAIQKPGILDFEEVDTNPESVQTALQPFLSNGVFTLLDGTCVKKHPQCLIFATGNTDMATRDPAFPGIKPCNEAFADRFRMIHVEYNHATAMEIAGNHPEIVEFCEEFDVMRAECSILSKRPLTYRTYQRIVSDMEGDDGDTIESMIRDHVAKSYTVDQLKRIAHAMKTVSNPWTKTFKKMYA